MISASGRGRAKRSQKPDKRVVAVLETAEWLALFPSGSDRFMHLPLTTREEKLNDSERGFSYPQPYYSIPPSSNRYRKDYERPNLRNSCKSFHLLRKGASEETICAVGALTSTHRCEKGERDWLSRGLDVFHYVQFDATRVRHALAAWFPE